MGAVKPVGQLYGSPTALTSQYLAWNRSESGETNISGKIRPTIAPEPRAGDQSLI